MLLSLAACGSSGSGSSAAIGFAPPVLFPTQGVEGTAVAVLDVDLDGTLDLVVASASSATISLLRGRDGGLFAAPVLFAAPARARSIATGDLDRDGDHEVLVVGDLVPQLAILDNDTAAGGLQPPRTVALPRIVRDVAVGDVTGDGHADVVLTGAGDALLVMLPGDGAGGFGAARELPLPGLPRGLVLADLDGNGSPETVTVTANGQLVAVSWRTTPPGVRAQALVGQGVALVLADLDGDLFPDLLVATADSQAGTVIALRGDGSGGLQPANSVRFDQPVTAVAAADLDADGRLDAVAVSGNRIQYAPGDGSGGFGAQRQAFASGVRPVALTAIDLQADGRDDLVFLLGSAQLAALRNPTATHAGLEVYGVGTPDCLGAIATYANSAPTLGNSGFALLVANAPPAALGVLLQGGPQDVPGSDPLGIGLKLHVGFDLLITDLLLSNGAGRARMDRPIPDEPSLSGLALYVQSLWLLDQEARCSAALVGAASSRGLAVTLRR